MKCRVCDAEYELAPKHVCEFCFGPLEVNYDYEVIRSVISREKIARGPYSIWRYQDLLPVEGTARVDLEAGFTPLVRADRLAKRLGIKELYIKNDTANPTWSFKDRVVSVALSRAVEFGFDTVACASTGNLANAVAAHAAHAGLRCFVFIPANLEAAKVVNALVYAPHVVAVRGNYDEVNRLCSEIADRTNWAFVNVNIRPYYSEGSKTLAFEVAEQLGWRAPDHVVVPIASGSLLTKVHKGFNELKKLNLIADTPIRISGAQAEGCSPVVQAYQQGADFVKPVKPDTIAKSLAIGNPADGIFVLDVIRETNGNAAMVSDDEIVEGIKLLAETEGIFTETAGGVTVGVLKKLAEQGKIKPDETTVAYVTGIGLKTQEAIAGRVGAPYQIDPNLNSFEQALKEKLQ
ncbi:MAG: threonine synthase [Armatimonadota bacterium]|nr:threonine synthase [Armatimonadota bacterium]